MIAVFDVRYYDEGERRSSGRSADSSSQSSRASES